MGIFSNGAAFSISIEKDLAKAKAQRESLEKRLTSARAEHERAVEQRRRATISRTTKKVILKADKIARRLWSVVDGLEDALTRIHRDIETLERQLSIERKPQEREDKAAGVETA